MDKVEDAWHEMIEGRDSEIANLRAAMRAVRDDLLLRGDLVHRRSSDGRIVVDVSQTVWNNFCAAIGDRA